MRQADQQLIRKTLFEFCKGNKGKHVFVGGMWTGDFIGTIVSYGSMDITFRVEKPINGGSSAPGGEYAFPYGKYLTLRGLTDEEKQMDIAEVYGEIHV